MVSMIKLKRRASFWNVAASRVISNPLAPRRRASASFERDVLSTVTSAPIDAASLTAMWPRPPRPTTATRSPFLQFHWRSGEYVVIPAQRSGEARAGSRPDRKSTRLNSSHGYISYAVFCLKKKKKKTKKKNIEDP